MNDIVAIVTANPVTVLTNEKTYSEFYARMKAECDEFVPDLSTAASRAKISSQAFKVTRTKTAIDAAGKKLNEDARAQINAVDASRRKIREELDALADAVRKPLTDWEEVEKARKEKANNILNEIRAASALQGTESSEQIGRFIAEIEDELVLDPDVFGEYMEIAVAQKSEAIGKLRAAMVAALQREADAAELSRLRAEAEAREIAEREAAEKARTEQAERDAEAERIAREKLAELRRMEIEQERVQRAEQEAKDREERARAEEQRKAREAIEKIEAEAARVKREADQREADRHAELKRIADEQAARDADRAHRSKVMAAAKTAIMDLGAAEDVAKKIVLAIIAGEVPQVRLTF